MLNLVALTNGEYLISSVALGVEEYYLGAGWACAARSTPTRFGR